jgi:hypothetical protein
MFLIKILVQVPTRPENLADLSAHCLVRVKLAVWQLSRIQVTSTVASETEGLESDYHILQKMLETEHTCSHTSVLYNEIIVAHGNLLRMLLYQHGRSKEENVVIRYRYPCQAPVTRSLHGSEDVERQQSKVKTNVSPHDYRLTHAWNRVSANWGWCTWCLTHGTPTQRHQTWSGYGGVGVQCVKLGND